MSEDDIAQVPQRNESEEVARIVAGPNNMTVRASGAAEIGACLAKQTG